MEQVFAAFGIDWRLLVIDTINFGLLLLILWYFLYGPLMRLLEERRARVAQSMHDADEATQRLQEIKDSRSDLLAEAGKEADSLVVSARAAARAKEQELMASGEASASRLLAEAQAEAREMKSRAVEESKKEVAKLVVLGMEKLAIEKTS
jgi:F-type H+-transporting ATPase subunit b